MKIRALSSFSHPQDSAHDDDDEELTAETLPLPPFFFPLVTPFPSGRHGVRGGAGEGGRS